MANGRGKSRGKNRGKKKGGPLSPEAANLPTARQPVAAEQVEPPVGTVVVRFGQIDVGGPWCLTKIVKDHHTDLLQRLNSIETMTIPEMQQRKVWKDYQVAGIPNREAKRRLVEINHDDETMISRLEISGRRRLYGFRRSNYFFALWWDPDHEIWPSSR